MVAKSARPKTHNNFWLPGPVKAQENVVIAGRNRYPLFFNIYLPTEIRRAELLRNAWQGRDNYYGAANTAPVLFTDFDKAEDAPGRLAPYSVDDWEKRFNEADSHQLNAPQLRDPANYDFRLKPNSELQKLSDEVPFKQLSDEKLRELAQWRAWLATLRPHEKAVSQE